MKKQHVQALYATKKALNIFLSIFFLLSSAFFLLSSASALAAEAGLLNDNSSSSENYSFVSVEYFYETGCLKCQQALPVINRVMERYPKINYSKYEVISSYTRVKAYGINTVPAIVVNQKTVIAYPDYEGSGTKLEALLEETIKTSRIRTAPVNLAEEEVPDRKSESGSGIESESGSGIESKTGNEISLFIVLGAGLLSGFNPCLLAVMAFLASITLSSGRRKKEMLRITAGFSAGIFTTYMLVGMSLLGTVSFLPRIQESLISFMIALIFLLGLWHIYDAYQLKTRAKSSFKTPGFLKKLLNAIEGKNILFLSFLAGALFSLVKAPCVGAVYISILNMLVAKTDIFEGILYLALYNLGLVLPVVLLGGLLAFGLSPAVVTEFRKKKRAEIRLATGLILVFLALLLHLKVI